MSIIKEMLAENLRKLRTKAGLSQEELGLRCEISARYVQMLEAGEKQPSLVTLFKLAYALNTKPEYLLKGAWEAWRQETD